MLVISVTGITSCRVLYKGLKYYTNMGQSAVECLLYKYELCMTILFNLLLNLATVLVSIVFVLFL